MKIRARKAAAEMVSAIVALLCAGAAAQSPSQSTVVRRIDDAVAARVENVVAFTDIEHYAVYRGKDETHPIAEMTVRDTYRKGFGKEYTILSQSGSGIVLHFGLKPLIENETAINLPANARQSLITSANYEMKLDSGILTTLDGRDCYVVAIKPKIDAPNHIVGRLWADAKDGTIIQIQGIASKSPSPFARTTHMMRQYTNIDGYSMATHARAESNSFFFGRTLVAIDYSDYHLELRENALKAGNP